MSRQTTEVDMPSTPRRPLWRRILKWTFRVLVILVALAALAWGVLDYVSAKALEAEINKMKAAGEPVTLADLEKSYPPVAEVDDAAPYYKAALALQRRSTDEQVYRLVDWLRPPSSQMETRPTGSVAEIEQVLAANAMALDMVDRGAVKVGCAYDWGLSYGFSAMLPQLSDVRRLARLVWLRTVHLAKEGKADEAARSLASSLHMLRMFDRQQVLVVYLVKVACTALTVDAVPAVLEAGDLSRDQLLELESLLAEADPSPDMKRVYLAEKVCTLHLFRNFMPGGSPYEMPLMPEAAPAGNPLGKPVVRMMLVPQLQILGRYAEAAGEGWPKALDAAAAIPRNGYGLFGVFAEILVPSLDKAFLILGRTVGQVRSAQVAVMVERYRLAKGKLPDSLRELSEFVRTDLPTDPFTGKELVYRRQGQGFLIYSVGDDKTDDGGLFVGPQRKDWGVGIRVKQRGGETAGE